MTTTPTPRWEDAAAVQAQVKSVRAEVLGGRGAGVNEAEIDQHTRARVVLNGEPTSQHLAAVAEQTALVSGNTEAIALDVAAARQHLAATIPAATATEKMQDPVSSVRFTARRVDALQRHHIGWAVLAGIAILVLRQRTRRFRKTV